MKTALIKPLRAPLHSWPCIAAFAAAAVLSGCDDTKPAANDKPAPAATAARAPATAAPAATVVPAATAGEAPAKVYDCGAKGQKLCPMQAWMKKVMAPASSAGDGPELAKALNYVADHAPPDYKGWPAIARDGAAKAKAGDIDGAKASCKQCHDAYKDKYKAELRDKAFP